VYECNEVAGSSQGSPLAADYVGCEAGRRTCSKRETNTTFFESAIAIPQLEGSSSAIAIPQLFKDMLLRNRNSALPQSQFFLKSALQVCNLGALILHFSA
jgi:hypothetical protein